MRESTNVVNNIPHELKHIQQFYAIDEIDRPYLPKTLPSQEVISQWIAHSTKNEDGTYARKRGVKRSSNSLEIYAEQFEDNYTEKVYGEKIPRMAKHKRSFYATLNFSWASWVVKGEKHP